jgi:iron complex outermembrane receptor protein
MKRVSPILLAGLTSYLAAAASAEDINRNSDIEEISVYGRLPGDAIKDIPQSVAVIDQEVLAISPVTTVGDVIRFIPTAMRNGSTLNSFGDTYLVRGFNTSQTINGLGFNRVSHARDIANVDHIEVLKGPSAVLYGQMEPGAVINVVTKQALDEFKADVGVELGSYNNQRYTADITGPITDSIRGRLNIAYQDSESFIDFWDLEHVFIAPNLSIDITEKTNLVIEGTYSKNNWGSFQNGRPAEGAFLPNPNGKYPQSFNPDEENIGFTHRNSADINFRLTHEIADDLLFRASYTRTRNDADFKEVFVAGLEDDFRTIDRAYFVGKDAYENDNSFLVDLTGKVTTGSFVHKFIAGINYRDSDSARPARFVFVDQLDMYNPVYGQISSVDPVLPQSYADFKTTEAFIQDRIAITDKFNVSLGARYTDARQDTRFISIADVESLDKLDETNWTTQIGLLYDFSKSFSIYANRSESFVPQFGTSSGGSPFPAEESTQYEIGTRFDVGDSGLQANAAIFIINKDNLVTSDPQNPGFNATLGEVESKGFESSIGGHIAPNWLLNVAYGFTDTEILQNFDGLKGNSLRNVPKNTISLQTRYDITAGLLKGLGLGGTVEYVENRYGDDENSFKLPGYTRIDLGAYYSLNDKTTIDVLLNNITDEDIYVEGYTTLRVIQEPGRTFLVRLKYNF